MIWDFLYSAVLFICGEKYISHTSQVLTIDFVSSIGIKLVLTTVHFVANKQEALYKQMTREGGEGCKTSFNVMSFSYVLVPIFQWITESKRLQRYHQRCFTYCNTASRTSPSSISSSEGVSWPDNNSPSKLNFALSKSHLFFSQYFFRASKISSS